MDVCLVIHDSVPRNIVLDLRQSFVPILAEQSNLAPETQHVLVHRVKVVHDLSELWMDFVTGDELLDHLLAHRDLVRSNSFDGLQVLLGILMLTKQLTKLPVNLINFFFRGVGICIQGF